MRRILPTGILSRDTANLAARTGFVCRACQQQQKQKQILQRRTLTNGRAPPRPPAAGFTALPSRQLLSVDGRDAAKFLQGIVTANVVSKSGLPRTDPVYSGLLNATGRVVHDVFIYPRPESTPEEPRFLIEVDADQSDRLAASIKRYKLRAKVAVRKLTPDEATVWHAWDDRGTDAGLAIPASSTRLTHQDSRAPGLGYRLIQWSDKPPELDLDRTTDEAYTIRRYLHGVPEGQDEIIREHALPQESNMELMHGIDFHKGCYVGQELTIRTRHRGVVRKRILPCVIHPWDKAVPTSLTYDAGTGGDDVPETVTADMIPAETSIGRFEKRGRSAGKWLKGVGNIGLGLCRLEIMTDIVLPGEPSSAPPSQDDEFLLSWGGEDNTSQVKVKAFVPDWVRQGIEAEERRG